MKDGNLRKTYLKLQETLRKFQIRWFDKNRKSDGPSKWEFCQHYSEPFKVKKAPGRDKKHKNGVVVTHDTYLNVMKESKGAQRISVVP